MSISNRFIEVDLKTCLCKLCLHQNCVYEITNLLSTWRIQLQYFHNLVINGDVDSSIPLANKFGFIFIYLINYAKKI